MEELIVKYSVATSDVKKVFFFRSCFFLQEKKTSVLKKKMFFFIVFLKYGININTQVETTLL